MTKTKKVNGKPTTINKDKDEQQQEEKDNKKDQKNDILKKDEKKQQQSNSNTSTTKTSLSSSSTIQPTNDQLISRATMKYPIFSCASGGNTDLVAVGGGGGVSKTGIPNGITLFRWVNGQLQQLETLITDDCVSNIAFHPSLDRFAYGTSFNCHVVDYNPLTNTYTPFRDFRSVPEKHIKDSPSGSKPSPLDIQQACRYNRDGDRLITGGSDHSVRVWKMPDGKLLNTLSGEHSDEITDVDVHPRASHIITTSKDKTCRVWNLHSGKVEHTFRRKLDGQDLGFRGSRFSVDGLSIFTAQSIPRGKNTQGCTYITRWNLSSGLEEKSSKIHTVHNTCLELSPDGRYLAVGTADSYITVVDTDTLKRVDRWEPHDFVITGLAFSPDSHHVLSVSADYTITAHRIGSGPKDIDYKLVFILAILILIAALIYQLVI